VEPKVARARRELHALISVPDDECFWLFPVERLAMTTPAERLSDSDGVPKVLGEPAGFVVLGC
jgi:hypothetical protein